MVTLLAIILVFIVFEINSTDLGVGCSIILVGAAILFLVLPAILIFLAWLLT